MSIKQSFPILALSLFVILGCVLSAKAQSRDSDLSWSEIKLSQEKERVLLETAQKDSVERLMQRQSDELYRLRNTETVSTQELTNLLKSHKEERLQLMKQFSEERTKLTQIHADERKAYLQNRSPK